ncbi:MAG: helix-turn-helix transcriptional regulator, partial [Rhizobiales bacterium]|nr:helix-turn-helix transcriptional regulator [Hyphomicrobiales bacterium]
MIGIDVDRTGQNVPSANAFCGAHDAERIRSAEREDVDDSIYIIRGEDIGKTLFLSPLTAKTHVSRIMQKLDARDRVQLVVIA